MNTNLFFIISHTYCIVRRFKIAKFKNNMHICKFTNVNLKLKINVNVNDGPGISFDDQRNKNIKTIK